MAAWLLMPSIFGTPNPRALLWVPAFLFVKVKKVECEAERCLAHAQELLWLVLL